MGLIYRKRGEVFYGERKKEIAKMTSINDQVGLFLDSI